MQPKLCVAVVVLYKRRPDESTTLQSLKAIAGTHPDLAGALDLLVYDNSPQRAEPDGSDPFSATLRYKHEGSNAGLAQAYGAALELAQQQGFEWLLLLDQDASLTAAFLEALLVAIQSIPSTQVCAIVPQLVRDGTPLSPLILRRGGETAVEPGIASMSLTVLNSAACLRVSALLAIGGFPPAYSLDYLDHVVFHRLQKAGGRVQTLPVKIEHQLSVRGPKDGPGELTLERYKRMLAAEWGYTREVRPKGGSVVQRLRLLRRGIEQLRLPDKAFALQTLASAVTLRTKYPR